jgi:hypothetical protein
LLRINVRYMVPLEKGIAEFATVKCQMQSNHMERMHMWSSFYILIEDPRLSPNVAVTVTKYRQLLSKQIF